MPSFVYTIKNSPSLFEDYPVIIQDKTVCPVICELKTQAGIDVPAGLGISFASPVFSLITDNKDLNGRSIDLQITCVAPLSKTGPGGVPSSAINKFTVQYRDECYDTSIIPASRSSYTAYLYQFDTKLYTKSMQTIVSCPPITETLIRTGTMNVINPAVFEHPAPGVIEVNPSIYENLGTYYFIIRSCVDVDGGLTSPICRDSSEFAVQITDPCINTQILTAPITTVMAQPQLLTDSLSLSIEMGPGWPWVDDVDVSISNSIYGTGLCGNIDYVVRTSDNQPTDLVFYDPFTQSLEFAPGLNHTPGSYRLKFRAYMFNYQWITDFVYFDVEVLACQTNIYSDFVFIQSVSTIWYDAPETLNIG